MLRVADFRDHLAMIKVGAAGRRLHPLWPPLIVSTIDYIDTALRPRRNWYVHDTWAAGADGKVYRLERSAKMFRPQSRQDPLLSVAALSECERADLETTVEEVRDHGMLVYAMACDLTWDHPPERAQALRETPPPQRLA